MIDVAETISEEENFQACMANSLLLPITRFGAVVIVRDENGYGCTLTDSGAVGLGATAVDAVGSAIEAEARSTKNET